MKITESRQEPFLYGSLGGTSVSLVPLPERRKVVDDDKVIRQVEDGQSNPVTYGGTGTRHFGTDTGGTIYQDTSNTALADSPMATGGTIAPVQ